MKLIISLFFTLGLFNVVLAQKHGYLSVYGETKQGFVKGENADTKPVLFFGTTRNSADNKVSPYKADAAYVPGKWKFVSFYLPDSKVRVWGNCYFDGKYKLVEYNGWYFFVDGKTSTALIQNITHDGVAKYKKQMAALLNQQVDYTYNDLSYQPGELIKPLVQLHELEGITYDVFKGYRQNKSHPYIELEYSSLNGLIYLNNWGQIKPEGVAANVGFGKNFNLPGISEKLFLTLGGKLGLYHFDEELYIEYPGIAQKIRFVRNIFVPSFSGGILIDLVDKPAFILSVKGSLDARKMRGRDTELYIETNTGNTIEQEHNVLRVKNEWLIFHNYEVLLGLPSLSESIQLGIGKSYCLTEIDQKVNEINIENTFNFKFYYRF